MQGFERFDRGAYQTLVLLWVIWASDHDEQALHIDEWALDLKFRWFHFLSQWF
mgnify:CR=1 FL=1